ncbi:ABC transporter permease [Caldicellulosiruptor sp. DIB 104C]|uniref:ABC transporter permease n=1 Tax=Caldicellulosiruptor sp. DIB 104C TaxID=3019889 RepID=UPI003BB98630
MISFKTLESEIKKLFKSKLILLIYFFYVILMIMIYRNTNRNITSNSIFSPYASGLLLYCNLIGGIAITIISALICDREYQANLLFIYSTILKRKYFFLLKQFTIFWYSLLFSLISILLGVVFDAIIIAITLPWYKLIIQLISVVFCLYLVGNLSYTLHLLTKNFVYSLSIPLFLIFFEPAIHKFSIKVFCIKFLVIFNIYGFLNGFFKNLKYGSIIIVPENQAYNSLLVSFFILLSYLIFMFTVQFLFIKSEKFSSK